MSEMSWYYARNGQQLGPVTLNDLKQQAADGQLQAEDLVWAEGMADWVEARRVPDVAAAFNNARGGDAGEYDLSPSLAPAPVAAPTYAAPYAAAGPYAAGPYAAAGQYPGIAQPGAMLGYGTYHSAWTQEPVYGGFWLRLVAVIIDGLILWVPNFLIQSIGTALVPQTAGGFNPAPASPGGGINMPAPGIMVALGGIWFAQIAVAWLFEALFVASKYQATPGKLALGLRVVDATGNRLTFGRSTGRHFAKILSSLICLIGYIMAAFDERKRALHDQICATFVVRK